MSFNRKKLGNVLVIGDRRKLGAEALLSAADRINEMSAQDAYGSNWELLTHGGPAFYDTVMVRATEFYALHHMDRNLNNPAADMLIELLDELAERNPRVQVVVCDGASANVRHADDWFRWVDEFMLG